MNGQRPRLFASAMSAWNGNPKRFNLDSSPYKERKQRSNAHAQPRMLGWVNRFIQRRRLGIEDHADILC